MGRFRFVPMSGEVALLVSAWIEIALISQGGLDETVALLVSAWIEMTFGEVKATFITVALLVSAWIEMEWLTSLVVSLRSHSS